MRRRIPWRGSSNTAVACVGHPLVPCTVPCIMPRNRVHGVRRFRHVAATSIVTPRRRSAPQTSEVASGMPAASTQEKCGENECRGTVEGHNRVHVLLYLSRQKRGTGVGSFLVMNRCGNGCHRETADGSVAGGCIRAWRLRARTICQAGPGCDGVSPRRRTLRRSRPAPSRRGVSHQPLAYKHEAWHEAWHRARLPPGSMRAEWDACYLSGALVGSTVSGLPRAPARCSWMPVLRVRPALTGPSASSPG